MTKADLIERVLKRKDLPRELTKKVISQIVDAVFMEVGDFFIRSRTGRKAARFSYPRFGTFVKKRRNARSVLNPQNGVPIQIPERVTVVVSPGLDLRELLNTEARASRRA